MASGTLLHHVDHTLFASTYALIVVSEIPDKTALATLLLAANNRPIAVFVGVAAAFVIQSAVAVAGGSLLSLLPPHAIRIGSGLLFLVFAAMMWRRNQPGVPARAADGSSKSFWTTVGLAFMVIFIAEWGDLTQLATAALSAKYPQPIIIFVSATLALWSVSAVAIVIGHQLKKTINPVIVQRIASVAFVIIGMLILGGLEL